jgi:hypothetical protein
MVVWAIGARGIVVGLSWLSLPAAIAVAPAPAESRPGAEVKPRRKSDGYWAQRLGYSCNAASGSRFNSTRISCVVAARLRKARRGDASAVTTIRCLPDRRRCLQASR